MKMRVLSLASMETVSVLLWESPKEWIDPFLVNWSLIKNGSIHWSLEGGGAQQAGDCTSQGFSSLEHGRLSVHTWLHLIAYLAPAFSHFLRKKKSRITWIFDDHSDLLSARDCQDKPKENFIYQRMMKSKFCSVMELFCLAFLSSLLIQLFFSQYVWKLLASHLHQDAPQCH